MGKESMSKVTFVKGLAAAAVVAASLGTLTVGEYAVRNTPAEPGTSSETAATEAEAVEASATGTTATETAGTEVSTEAPVGETASEPETFTAAETETESAETTVAIGGSDGPSAVFVAGKDADEISYMDPVTYETVYESPEAPFAPGTYSASAAGISSDVTVTMEFDENRILSMDVDVSGESHGKGSLIDTELAERILSAQTSEVDGVSGATVTSDAIRAAAADCIAQAQDKTTAEAEAETESESEIEAESELFTPAELAAAED